MKVEGSEQKQQQQHNNTMCAKINKDTNYNNPKRQGRHETR